MKWPGPFLATCQQGYLSCLVHAVSSTVSSLDDYNSQSIKHDTLKQCWFDVGPASQTVGKH